MKITHILVVMLTLASCQKRKDDYLLRVYKGELDEVGVESGYVNIKGDTIIPLGKYHYCYTQWFVKNQAAIAPK